MLNGIWGFFLIGGILTGAFLGRMDMADALRWSWRLPWQG